MEILNYLEHFTLEELNAEQRRRELSRLTYYDLQELINIEQYEREIKKEIDEFNEKHSRRFSEFFNFINIIKDLICLYWSSLLIMKKYDRE